jgi:acyl dehydratase
MSAYRVISKIPLEGSTTHYLFSSRTAAVDEKYAFLLSTIPYYRGDISKLKEGQYAIYQRSFTNHGIERYSKLIGDFNPIHFGGQRIDDASSLRRSSQNPCIVQGIYVASIFSSVFGTIVPGSLYRTQTLNFLRPVYANHPVIGRVEITSIKRMKGKGNLVTCNTSVYCVNQEENHMDKALPLHPSIHKQQERRLLIEQEQGHDLSIQGTAEVWIPASGQI